jgi:polyhydroxybutyrate depolymerase
MRHLPLGLVVLVSAAFASCAGGGNSSTAQRPSGCSNPGHSFSLRLRSGGLERTAIVHVPPHAGTTRLPLLLAFHFAGGTGRAMEAATGLSPFADVHRFIAVYPDADGSNHFWNISSARSRADDVRFVRDLLGRLSSRICFDSARVYATGVSNGGGMAARVGCDLSDVIAAVAPVAGGYSTLPDCGGPLRASLLEIHGTGDPIVPYGGRGPAHAGAALPFARGWAKADGCGAAPVQTRLAKDAVRFEWPGCIGGRRVAHIRLDGFGHGWPGGPGPVFRGRDSSFPANRVIWRFVSSRRLQSP